MKPKYNNAVGPQVRKPQKQSNALMLALLLVFVWLAFQATSQYLAHTFAYHDSLGANMARAYPPWSAVVWYLKWGNSYPELFQRALTIGMMVLGGGFLFLAVIKMAKSNGRSKGSEYLHGSARWAEEKQIKEAGLLPTKKFPTTSDSVYVGGWVDKSGAFHYLRHSGPEHVLTYAPTRSGKGVGLVVPTMLSWSQSAVITDLKGELWALTAGWRQKHAKNKVLRFEPAALNGSIQWNPMDEIRLGTEYEVGDVQNLANLIVDPDGKGLINHWQKTSYSLLCGVILHALYKRENEGTTASLPAVDAMLSNPERDINELWVEMMTYGHVDGRPHPAIGPAAKDQMDRPEEEAGSVLSTAKSYLSLYRDPVVARNVSQSQFRIKDLMHGDTPASLYIITQPNDKARLRPLVRVMVNMIIRLLADKMEFKGGRPVKGYKHRLLMMLDEFPSLGKLEILQESLAFVAGYGIKCYLICQDINQLKSRETGYGPDETVTSNCHIQNAYPPNRLETAEHLSKLTGQTTVLMEKKTYSGRSVSPLFGNVSRTSQEVARPLLTPDECQRMPGPKKNDAGEITEPGDMVIYVAGYPAIYGRQPLFFQDPIFRARAAIEAPSVTDTTKTVVAREEVTL